VLEVYPAAALLLWGLPRERYKASAEAREELLSAIEAQAPWLGWEPGAREACVSSDDALDAVLCALVARAAALGLTGRE
jgi:predicted nuclease with RNAse H fold